MKRRAYTYAGFMLLALFLTIPALAQTKKPKPKPKPTPTPVKSSVLTDGDIASGLKEALANGVTSAVKVLGTRGGYYSNPRVKIPMPKALQPVEKTMRFLRQDDMVDDFVVSMNHAAESAVGEATMVFLDSIKQMTFQDAKNILTGPKDSATQFFRRTSEEKLREKFLPIVQTSTEETGVTANFKKLMDKAGPAAALIGQKDFDLDEYITQKALEGLFLMVADEEKRIRENPVARTTSILKKVFGSIIK